MKVMVQEVEGEGLPSLLGKNIEVWTGVYIYAGLLIGVNNTCIKLDNCHVVYETGNLDAKSYKDAQKMPMVHYIQTNNIISFGETSKLK